MAMVLVQGSGNPKIVPRVIAIVRLRFAWPIHWFSAWRRDVADRRYLATLNEYSLKDIGLTRRDVAPDSSPPIRLW
jgi:uncharacterized protein YjiS (DUF1127 family)